MTEACVGVGSNLGDREAYLEAGLKGLAELATVVARSSVYETAPIGGPPQDPYLNMVAVIETDLEPAALLEALRAIEDRNGRERGAPAEPRTLDLDLLLYGETSIDEPGLRVPHPRMLARRFVVEPLLEARPKARLPDGREVADYIEVVAHQEVRRYPGSA
ncbi:MAG: 2-amino-4-hydroxy-6-hydroxymethyldihydropteridine diphosphokinase [Proteobacteria bacterium]|nr:2-amino-4-hydroxy-6-hydroxymethyldihydropteridine diphosphokinase [Pseudomonadota bacterium]